MDSEQELQVAVIVVAAGSGERLGQGRPKAQAVLGSEPLLAHAVRGVVAARVAQTICVVVPRGDTELRELCHGIDPGILTVDGGSTRSDSVGNALAVLPTNVEAVLVHDAARPLAPEDVFHRVRHALEAGAQAAIPVLAVADTIKKAQPATEPGIAPEQVHSTPRREELRAVQTPQGFNLATLRAAHEAAAMFNDAQAAAITDDAMLVESRGVPVYLVRGSELSLKITTPIDLLIAEALLEGPAAPRWVEG